FIYAAPNLYGEDSAVQVRGNSDTIIVDETVLAKANAALLAANVPAVDTQFQGQTLLFRFLTTDAQLKAKEVIQQTLGEDYLVALNLISATPPWLKAFGATPMKLGLDL